MEVLQEIGEVPVDESVLPMRQAARAILFDKNNKIPLLYLQTYNYHKLPGGGIEDGEDKIQALDRECLEEIGCEINVIDEVGKIIEYRKNLKQISYCYYGNIVSKGTPHFTPKEVEQGCTVVWFALNDALAKLEQDASYNYESSFIQKRDLTFLKKLKQMLGK